MGLYGRIHGYEEEGEGESTRSALMRSDDGGENWEYYSTLAYDPANIIDYEEPALLRLKDGRLVCFMRTHVNPSGDAKNMVMTISEDDGFSWTPPKWTKIWGYPPETDPAAGWPLPDGLRLSPPALWRARHRLRRWRHLGRARTSSSSARAACRGATVTETPGSSRMTPASGKIAGGGVDWSNPGVYQHIGYPSVVQMPDGTIVCSYHEWSDDSEAAAIRPVHALPRWRDGRRAEQGDGGGGGA